MTSRWFPVAAFCTLFFVACSTSQPAPPDVDPTTDPTHIGAIDEAAVQGSAEAEAITPTAQNIGRVAGVLAAVLGGADRENFDDTLERYFFTRDLTTGMIVTAAATKGAMAGAKRGHEMDLQFAELRKLEGLDVLRPYPDEIEVYLPTYPDRELLASVAAVFAGREQRAIEVEGASERTCAVLSMLMDMGIPSTSFRISNADDEMRGVVLRIRYRG